MEVTATYYLEMNENKCDIAKIDVIGLIDMNSHLDKIKWIEFNELIANIDRNDVFEDKDTT